MNEWTIYDKSGAVRAEVKELEYHGEWLGEEYVTVTVKSATPVAWEHGDFMEYRNAGDTYVIDYDPSTIKRAESGKYPEAFVYENVKLYSEGHALKDVLFKDYVLDDNCLAYSQQAKFSFFAGGVEELADRLQANLNKAFGYNVWLVFTPDGQRTDIRNGSRDAWDNFYTEDDTKWDFPLDFGLTDINVSCDGISCFDALRQSYDLFGLPFVFVGKNIIIGGNMGTVLGRRFSYGRGNGLYEIEKSTDEQKQVVTKMFAYGSSENMPLNYYANLHKYYFARATDIEVSSDVSTIDTDPYPFIQLRMDVDFMRSMFTNVNTWTDSDGNTYKNLGYVVRVRLDTTGMTGMTDVTITARVNNPAPVDDDGKVHIYAEYSGGEDPADEPNVDNMRRFIKYAYQIGRSGRWVTLIFERGIDVNRWPQDLIAYTQQNTYPALLSISNLMLPGFPDQSLYAWVKSHTGTNCNDATGQATWHGMTAYFSKEPMNPWIKSLKAGTYGEKEGAVYFDGSNQDVKNVKPTIENTGANYASAQTTIQDNGYLAEGTDLSFTLAVPVSNAVNWEEIWLNRSEDMYVNMISGYCTGRSFRVLSRPAIKLDGQGNYYWELRLERSKDSSLERYFPYQDTVDGSDYAQISPFDYLNVTGVQLPKSYVDAAAEVLLEEALKALGRMDHPKMVYVPRIDEIFAARDRDSGQPGESFYDKIRPGMQLRFADADLFGEDGGSPIVMTRFIDQLTIKENGNNGIPTFDVVLRDEKDETLEQRIANQISSMGGGTSSGSGSSSGGGSGSGSGEGGISTDELETALETKVDTDWLSMLFEVHRRTPSEEEGGETLDEVIPPNDYADLVPDDPTVSIKAKYGLWTDQFLSALGLGESGGGGSTDLNWPLDAINDAGMSMNPNVGDTIVYDGDGGFYWGNAGVDEGRVNTLIATYLSDNDYKAETELDGRYLQKASESMQNISLNLLGNVIHFGNYRLLGGLEVDGSIRLLRGSGNLDDADILNMGETTSLIENVGDRRYVKIDFFERLLTVHNGNNIISTNGSFPQDASSVNIEAMFGFWTEQFLSARGLGPSGGGGGLNLNEPLLSINNLRSNPSAAGQTLVWRGGSKGWEYGAAGADPAQIQSIVNSTLSAYRWWGRPADANNSVIGDMTNVGDISFQASGKNIGGLVFFDTTYHHVGIGSAPFVPSTGQTGYTLDVTGNIRATQTSWFPAIELRGTQESPNTYIDFHYGTIENDYTNRIIEEQETVGGNEYRYLRVRTAAGKAGLVIGNSTNGDYIKIGGATLSWDSTNSALKIDTGVYSDSFVSAHGLGPSGGGGGGDVSIETFTLNTFSLSLKLTGQTARNVDLSPLRRGLVEEGTLRDGYLPLTGGRMKNNSDAITNLYGLGFSASDGVDVDSQGNIKLRIESEYWRVNNKSGQVILACYQNTQSTYEGRVGIGTAAPAHKLHVDGSIMAKNTVYLGGNNSDTNCFIGRTNDNLYLQNNNNSGFVYLAGYKDAPIYMKLGSGGSSSFTMLHSGSLVIDSSNVTGIKIDNTTYNIAGSGTDTKNTAGNTNDATATTLYLIGVKDTSGSYAQTYRRGNCYISSNGDIYSNNTKVLVTTDISSWAKASSKPSYNLDEVLDGTSRKLSNFWSKTEITSLKNLTQANHLGWSDATSDAKKVVTSNTIAYWNGLYDNNSTSSNTHSNLEYCKKGKFGSIITKDVGDYPTSDTKNTAGATSQTDIKLYLIGANGQTANPLTYTNGNVYISDTNVLNAEKGIKCVNLNIYYTSATGSGVQTGAHIETTNKDLWINSGTATPWVNKNWQNSSDIRKKNIIKNIDRDVKDVASAPIFDFSWKDGDNSLSLGTSAQYWQGIFANGVKQGPDGYLYMDYGATALAAAVMTARKVVTHEERIKALEEENKRLRKEIETLKAA